MHTRRTTGTTAGLLTAALLIGVLVQAQQVARAAAPKVRPPQPLTSHVSGDLLRLLQPGPAGAAPARLSGVSPAMMQWSAPNTVGVTITAVDPAALAPVLRQLGMRVSAVAPEHHLLEGFVPLQVLPRLEALAPRGLLGVAPMLAPLQRVGAVTSEADFVLQADRVRATVPPGTDGTGVKVGVLSDSFNRLGGAPADVSSGDLPAVQVLEDSTSGNDEGRAMCQLIHDLAPGSPLAFATANGGEAHFAENIRDLADPAKGACDVVVDDVIYFTEPMFQDGIVAQAANEVVTQRGAAYFSAAGNQANQGFQSTSFHASPDAGIAGSFLDWDPGAGVQTRQRIAFPAGRDTVLTLQWDDPFYTTSGVDTDLGLIFLTPGTNNVVGTIDDNNITSQRPVELADVDDRGRGSSTFDVMIRLTKGPAPGRLALVSTTALDLQPVPGTTPTIYGHAAAKQSMAIAADPYFDQKTPESFSSQGPATILFASTGTRLGAAEVRQKPDLTSIDGTNTTFFTSDRDGDGHPNFFGTSAAAPHAAAVAALVLQANPGMAPQALSDRLKATATDLGTAGPDLQTGAGLINAYSAIFGAVTAAALPFIDGFEGGAISKNYEVRSSGAGRVDVASTGGPAAGARHAALDSSRDTFPGLNELTLHFAVPANSGAVTLAFKEKEFSDADDPMPATFDGSVNADGVALSVDGAKWFRVTTLTGANSTDSYQSFSFNLTQVAQAAGLTLGSDVRVRFQQFGSRPLGSGGITFDDIAVSAAPGPAADLLWSANKIKETRKGKGASLKVTFTGSLTAKNGGKVKSPACKVHYFLSTDNVLDVNQDRSLKEVTLVGLNPGQTRKLTLNIKLPKRLNPAHQFFIALVDSREGVPESNEANNVLAKGPLR